MSWLSRLWSTSRGGSSDPLDRLLACRGVRLSAPATPAELRAVEERFGGKLPELLTRQWLTAATVEIESEWLSLTGPQATLDRADWSESDDGSLADRGLVPIVEDSNFNFVCVAVKPPLAPRVVYFDKGDFGRLKARDLSELYETLASSCGIDEPFEFCDVRGAYADPFAADARDRADAHATLESGRGLEFAVQLLHPDDLEEWDRLRNIRRTRAEVLSRLANVETQGVQALLRKDAAELEEFVELLREAARAAGLPAGERRGDVLSVGRAGYNVHFFFCRRNVPNAFERIVWWFKDQAEDRNPYHRPGHLDED